MARGPSRGTRAADAKLAALKATGTLNRNPRAVVDPLFRGAGAAVYGPDEARDLRISWER